MQDLTDKNIDNYIQIVGDSTTRLLAWALFLLGYDAFKCEIGVSRYKKPTFSKKDDDRLVNS